MHKLIATFRGKKPFWKHFTICHDSIVCMLAFSFGHALNIRNISVIRHDCHHWDVCNHLVFSAAHVTQTDNDTKIFQLRRLNCKYYLFDGNTYDSNSMELWKECLCICLFVRQSVSEEVKERAPISMHRWMLFIYVGMFGSDSHSLYYNDVLVNVVLHVFQYGTIVSVLGMRASGCAWAWVWALECLLVYLTLWWHWVAKMRWSNSMSENHIT